MGIWPGQRGYTYSLREVPWDFLMTTESQDLGLESHPKDGYDMALIPSLINIYGILWNW